MFQREETLEYPISGLDNKGNVLDSVEFLDLETNKWTLVSSMKVGRMEHIMSLIYGIPTVVGGRSFLGALIAFVF